MARSVGHGQISLWTIAFLVRHLLSSTSKCCGKISLGDWLFHTQTQWKGNFHSLQGVILQQTKLKSFLCQIYTTIWIHDGSRLRHGTTTSVSKPQLYIVPPVFEVLHQVCPLLQVLNRPNLTPISPYFLL